jgi:NADH-quinone oxidoreductase subunit E
MAVEFSAENERQIERLLARYPNKRAACIPVLHLAQAQFGYLSGDAIDLVAKKLDLSPAEVFGTASFYTMFRFKPEGRHHVEICTNISCMIGGAYKLVEHCEKKLGCKLGETTKDGAFTLREVECLAACDLAPMMQLDEDFVGPLDVNQLDKLLEDLQKRDDAAGAGAGRAAAGGKG